MAKRDKRYLIKGLKKSMNLEDASKIILDEKLKSVFLFIDLFFEDDSVKNLHKLRITLRRFRYLLESLYLCVDDKLFFAVLRKTRHILDCLGEGRDQDMFVSKFSGITRDKKILCSEEVSEIIDLEKVETRQKIKRELIKFICDKNVNKFFRKNKIERGNET